MKIVKATLKDLESIRKLNQELFYHDYKFDKTLNLNWPSKNKDYYKKRILDKNSLVLIVKENNKAIGYLIGTITKCENYRKIHKIAELDNMLVKKEHRNQNIGSKLIKELFKWTKSKKFSRLKVVTSSKNKKAIRFYKKNSFFEYHLALEAKI